MLPSVVILIVSFCLQGLVLAGLSSGLTEGVAITPFERVKVSLQSNRALMAEVGTVGYDRY